MSKAKILIVEDSKDTVKLIQKHLKELEHEVSAFVASGEEAIKKAEDDKPDLVLMDIQLSGKMDGIEAAKIIRSRFDIPSIFVTAHSQDKLLERAKIAEPFGYIIKPFEKRDLHSNIEMALFKHKTEKKLKENEERYSAVAEDTPLLICRFSPDCKIIYVNQAYCKFFKKKAEELVGHSFLPLIDEADRKTVIANISTLTVYSPTQSHEQRVSVTNDKILWQRWTNRALFDTKGKVVAYQSIGEDITERKKLEEELHHKTELLLLLQEVTILANETSAPEEVTKLCIEKICDYMNWPIGHLYIVDSKGMLIPSKIWHIKNSEQFDTFRKITEVTSFEKGMGLPGRVLATKKPAWIKDVTKDPNFPRVKLAKKINVKAGFAFPILEGTEVAGVLEFFSNEVVEPDETMLNVLSNLAYQIGRVTERKQSEESLKKLINAIEYSAESVVITDVEGIIEYVNPAFVKITEYSKSEVIGVNQSDPTPKN